MADPHLILDAAQDLEILLRDLPSEHLNVLLDPFVFG